MHIFQIDPKKRRQRRQFLDLPFQIYARTPQWVPPLAHEARLVLDPERHPFYQHSQAAFFLALEGGQPVGRLAVLDNHNYNQFNRERTAFFYLFECEDRQAVSGALFEAGFEWARRRGLDKIIGPRGFTVFDGLGLLVKGFEHRPAFGLPYNPPYYPALVEAAGFVTDHEAVSGYLDAQIIRFPEKIHQVAERVRARRGLVVKRFRKRGELRALAPRLKDLYNAALGGTTGNVPITEAEAQTLADQLIWFADPGLIKIVMKDEQPVGFLFAYPDISAALQRTRGRLFPFGWLHMLLELRRTEWININGAGMIEGYRGLGGTALLFSEMYKTVAGDSPAERRYHYADIVQIGVDNEAMQREMRDLGIDFYKTHRTYTRPLK